MWWGWAWAAVGIGERGARMLARSRPLTMLGCRRMPRDIAPARRAGVCTQRVAAAPSIAENCSGAASEVVGQQIAGR
jgi:hypothetical protein